jgi:hypothetical protein
MTIHDNRLRRQLLPMRNTLCLLLSTTAGVAAIEVGRGCEVECRPATVRAAGDGEDEGEILLAVLCRGVQAELFLHSSCFHEKIRLSLRTMTRKISCKLPRVYRITKTTLTLTLSVFE